MQYDGSNVVIFFPNGDSLYFFPYTFPTKKLINFIFLFITFLLFFSHIPISPSFYPRISSLSSNTNEKKRRRCIKDYIDFSLNSLMM